MNALSTKEEILIDEYINKFVETISHGEILCSRNDIKEFIKYGIDLEANRVGEKLGFVHREYDVDGSGVDSGDYLDVLESEIRKAVNKYSDLVKEG